MRLQIIQNIFCPLIINAEFYALCLLFKTLGKSIFPCYGSYCLHLYVHLTHSSRSGKVSIRIIVCLISQSTTAVRIQIIFQK